MSRWNAQVCCLLCVVLLFVDRWKPLHVAGEYAKSLLHKAQLAVGLELDTPEVSCCLALARTLAC
jgi:hypothetical protein